ncbi:MAG: hypothetical protein A4E49_02311 [Methanosaeta sp. PtaU1.Bin112]|nr:MAG: hypothetical protein A4E49_02311 [Methanosaeta sp. PtaU1.Bin112]
MSSQEFSGKKMPLVDSYAIETRLSSSQWRDLLQAKFDDARSKDEPVVISLSTPISGTGEYLGALKQFLEYTLSKDVQFVTTMDLVNMTLPTGEEMVLPAAAAVMNEEEESGISNLGVVQEGASKCATCEAAKKVSINATAMPPTMAGNATE